jgi:queuine tRNA-ribosyltransferase
VPFGLHLHATDGAARTGEIRMPRGVIRTPAFMPVGTAATVKGMYPDQVKALGADVVLGNTYHLMLRPSAERIARLGGLHRFMNWPFPILTDSGGFQVMSLSQLRKITEQSVVFQSHIDGSRHEMSPERSVEIQNLLGSDIVMQLDECVSLPCEDTVAEKAMRLSLRWAERCQKAFGEHPGRALFAIVQGGVVPSLRKHSAAFLAEHAFDGFAIGGLAVGDTRSEREDLTALSAELLPATRPRYLMGVGTPPDLLNAMLAGVDMFDCIIPTQLAWQGTAFTATGRVRLTRTPNALSEEALDPTCPCSTCTTFSRAYLHHLFKCREPLGPRLVSMHNLHYYHALMASSRRAIEAGTFASFAKDQLSRIDRHEHSATAFGAVNA